MVKLRFAQLVELVTWAFIEEVILSAWFPDQTSTVVQHMSALHAWIRAGGEQPPFRKTRF
jgi:hypothetical protein